MIFLLNFQTWHVFINSIKTKSESLTRLIQCTGDMKNEKKIWELTALCPLKILCSVRFSAFLFFVWKFNLRAKISQTVDTNNIVVFLYEYFLWQPQAPKVFAEGSFVNPLRKDQIQTRKEEVRYKIHTSFWEKIILNPVKETLSMFSKLWYFLTLLLIYLLWTLIGLISRVNCLQV